VGQPGELVAAARGTGSRPVLVQILCSRRPKDRSENCTRQAGGNWGGNGLLQAFNMEHRASRAGLARDAHCMDFSKPQMIISLPDAATENAGKGFWKMQRTNRHQETSEQGGEGQGCSVLGTVLRICFDLPNVRALLAMSLPRRVVPSRFPLIVCTSLGFVKVTSKNADLRAICISQTSGTGSPIGFVCSGVRRRQSPFPADSGWGFACPPAHPLHNTH
jgi:hypothetical protein